VSPGDIVFWRDDRFGKHRFWEIQGIYLGAEGQESIVELKNLLEKPGRVSGHTTAFTHTFVPEPLLRHLAIYTPVEVENANYARVV
jgi:hypothetical protein